MKIIFRTNELENLSNGIGDYKYPDGVGKKYRAILHAISKMNSVKDILAQIGRFAEWKKGDRSDQIGIHINKGWRLMLKVEKDEIIVIVIREVTNHYQ